MAERCAVTDNDPFDDLPLFQPCPSTGVDPNCERRGGLIDALNAGRGLGKAPAGMPAEKHRKMAARGTAE